jgi:Glycine zipper 2TM domain
MTTPHLANQKLSARSWVVLGLSAMLAACVTPPPQRQVVQGPPPPPPQQLVVYPARGQSPEQQERDRYECHVWAVQQTGFDPSQPGVPSGQRVIVQPANPPGTGTAVGAIAGAILGAVIGGPRNAGAGLLVGGLAGAAVGTASDVNAQSQANYEQQRVDAGYNANAAQGAQRAANYRRAISACLDARGYTTA